MDSTQFEHFQARLTAAGWKMSEEAIDELGARIWEIRGVQGERVIVARSVNRLDAWQAVALHAKFAIE